MKSLPLYSPIIKGKLNDLKAISKLTEGARLKIKPLIEAMPLHDEEKTLENHLKKFVSYIEKYVTVEEIFVDFYGLSGMKTLEGVEATLAGFDLLKTCSVTITPTYGFERDDDLWSLLSPIVKNFGAGFCFRIDIDDLDDQAEDTMSQILERSSQLRLKPKEVDLFIDLRDVADRNLDELKDLVLDFLQFIPSSVNFRSIILAGSSALKTVADIPMEGVIDVARQELHLWAKLQRDLPESISLIYGDYGVVHPDFVDGIRNKYMNAKIRYTTRGRITYFRGHGLLHPVKDYEQYRKLADKVRNSSCYMGLSFSAGDKYINDVAAFNETHGAPATWVLADMNHHLEYTVMQITELVSVVRAEKSASKLEALL
ncbi:MAG: hypothetical protein ABIQ95_03800 [Bdellovibrionia bacterium]